MRVLGALESARKGTLMTRSPWVKEGGWVNKQYFVREMYLTQAGRAIHNLEKRMGVVIEHSDFKDEYGFKFYRLPPGGPEVITKI